MATMVKREKPFRLTVDATSIEIHDVDGDLQAWLMSRSEGSSLRFDPPPDHKVAIEWRATIERPDVPPFRFSEHVVFQDTENTGHLLPRDFMDDVAARFVSRAAGTFFAIALGAKDETEAKTMVERTAGAAGALALLEFEASRLESPLRERLFGLIADCKERTGVK